MTTPKPLSKTRKAWVEAAILYGLTTDRVPRKAVVAIAAKTPHVNWPAWLTGDKTRRLERGVFSCPEIPNLLAEKAMEAEASEDLEDQIAEYEADNGEDTATAADLDDAADFSEAQVPATV